MIIRKSTDRVTRQILANTNIFWSLSCQVPKTLANKVENGRSLVLAGTPLYIDTVTDETRVARIADSTYLANALLLHDVDVTDVPTGGDANTTALTMGVVNISRVDDSIRNLMFDEFYRDGASKLVTFIHSK